MSRPLTFSIVSAITGACIHTQISYYHSVLASVKSEKVSKFIKCSTETR